MAESRESKQEPVSTAELALQCSDFFLSLSQYCLDFYHSYNREIQRKTKMIKKAKKIKPKIRNMEGQNGERNDEQISKKIPKKPLTAYIIYFQEKKPNFVERYQGLNLSDLTKLIAKQWKQINQDERKPYLEQAQQDRKRYEEQMKEFKLKYGTLNQQNEQQAEQQIGEIERAKSSQMKAEDEDQNQPPKSISQNSEKKNDNKDDKGDEKNDAGEMQ